MTQISDRLILDARRTGAGVFVMPAGPAALGFACRSTLISGTAA